MPARSRQASSRAAAQPEEEEGSYNIPNLDFNEPLSWRAGRAIPVADLFTRLEKLLGALKAAEQATIEVKDIAKLAQDLVHPNLLGHKDKGIRAYVLAAVVEVLNVCAPNAPFKPNQLHDIFTVFINTILPALGNPTNAYNAQHLLILESLVDTQSIVLLTDLQDFEALAVQLFTVSFDLIAASKNNPSGVEMAKGTLAHVGAMLETIVDEAEPLPQDVVDIILSQFFRMDPRTIQQQSNKKKGKDAKDKSQSTLLPRQYPPAYDLARNICTICKDKMGVIIGKYFSDIVTNASEILGTDDGARPSKRALTPESDSDNDEHDTQNDLRKVHRLVRELWKACPDALTNVVQQLELELSADSALLRQLAVETLGDMVAGIGIAGLPELPTFDPAAFPLPTISRTEAMPLLSDNPLLIPSTGKPFVSVYASVYQQFLGRRVDRAVLVRQSWAKAAARILLTRAGGIGLSDTDQNTLASGYAHILRDIDDRVRLVALQQLEHFPYPIVVEVLACDGGLSQPTSLLSAVAERALDKKVQIRDEAMLLLGSMWGVASRDIANGNDRVSTVLGQAPSRLFAAMYVKDSQVVAMLCRVLYECLLPLSFPPLRKKGRAESQSQDDALETSMDADTIRVRRLLTLVRDLDEKARAVFFGLQKRQADMSRGMLAFLNVCEEYNGGVLDDTKEEKRLAQQLTRYIESLSRQLPDHSKASVDLWKFAKAHDRRCYQLIKFATGAEHDYKTMMNSIKELTKRARESNAGLSTVVDTLRAMLHQCALISYNRSHIPAIMEHAKTADSDFSEAAQEVLREISEKVPEVMTTHIKVLCKELEDAAPSDTQAEALSSIDALRACATFAKRFPKDLPHERKFEQAILRYVQFSRSPKAAKYATNIVLTTSDKPELRAKEILSKALQRHSSGASNKLAQLAAIAQVCLKDPVVAETEEDALLNLTNTQILYQNLSPDTSDYRQEAWSDDIDEETASKQLALKILTNRCRSGDDKSSKASFDHLAEAVLEILMNLISNHGEITPAKDTPSIQRNHLRLTACRSIVKLCRHKQRFEELVVPTMFQSIAWNMVQVPNAVRRGLISQIKKYTSQNRLNIRWITPLFLLAFEPNQDLRTNTMSWLKSKAAFYVRQQKQARTSNEGDKKVATQNVMEVIFARLLSLLVHHPDYPPKDDPTYDEDLLEFAQYIIFYLQCCATEENLSLIFHIAQRVKQALDGLSANPEIQERLYTLSDLAQATIRNYADHTPSGAKGVNLLPAWPGKAHLPTGLFKPINGREKAQEIAAKNYLPEETASGLPALVRKAIRHSKPGTSHKTKTTPATVRKRKPSVSIDVDDDDLTEPGTIRKSAKKLKTKTPSTSLPIRKTPNSKKRKSESTISVEHPSRKSARRSTVTKVNYEESDDDEDEEAQEDAEDVVKYTPAPIEKHKHKSTKAATPQIETDEDEEQGDQSAEEARDEVEEAASPTPKGKLIAESEDSEDEEPEEVEGADGSAEPNDAEMTNGHDEEETDEANAEDEDMTDDNGQVEVEADNNEAKETEGSELEPSPPPERTKRASRSSKVTPVSKLKSLAKAKGTKSTKEIKSRSKAEPKGSKSKSPAQKKETVSSPAVIPTRRTTRHTKV